MKFFLISIILILSINSVTQAEKSTIKPIDLTNQNFTRGQLLQLKNKQRATDSLLAGIDERQSQLKQENDIFKTTIETNSNIFAGISTYFSIVSILLTIIVIVIPLINYFLVLKPNQKIVEKVENLEAEVLKTMEKNFESHFEKLRRQKTTKVLSLLDDRLKLSEVTSYFFLNSSDNLEEVDILKLIEFLSANKDLETGDAYILNSLVIGSGLLIAEKYYKSIFEKDEDKNFDYAIEYLVENDFESHVSYIEKIIKANEKGHHLLIKFFDYLQKTFIGNRMDKKGQEKKEIGIKYAKLLFDNDNILKAIADKEEPKTFGLNQHPININRLNDNEYLRDTKYYNLYLEEMDKKYR